MGDMRRRSFLLSAGALGTSPFLAAIGCSRDPANVPKAATAPSASDTKPTAQRAGHKALLVFFSRAGENYFNGGRKVLQVGNTEVVAGMIRQALDCDVFRIQPVGPYSDRYDPTVQRNVREQDENARPGIVDLPASIAAYDTVLIGSPIWNVRVPRIMLTFAEHFDFAGKTVHPFTTYAMSGLGQAVEEYTAACRGATIGKALAVHGEEVEGSRSQVEAWLRSVKLLA